MPYLDPEQTDRGRQAPFSGGPKHDSAIKFGMSPYLWGANWRSGHHISKPATAMPGMERGSKSGSLHYGRLFFCALAPSSLALGAELPARPTQPIPLPAALHSICVRRSMC